MNNFNINMFKSINGMNQNYILDIIGKILAQFSPYIIILLIVYLIFNKKNKAYRNIGLLAIYTGVSSIFIDTIIRLFYYHHRPFMMHLGKQLITHSPESSFPSDHTTFICSIAIMLIYFKETRIAGIISLFVGVLCGIARIYCGVHFPLDIIGGLIIGLFVSSVLYYFKTTLYLLNQFIFESSNKFLKYINDSEYSYRKKSIIIFSSIFTLWMLIAYNLPLIDPSEGRYAVISKKMAETGNYITPYILDNGKWLPFLGKPPLFFWISSLSIKIFGTNVFAVRFPNVLASIILLILIFIIIKRYKDEKTAYMSTILTASSGLFFICTTTVLADIIMTLFSVGALFFYYGFINEKNKKIKYILSILIFIFLGFAFLAKGPVALIIFGLPVFLWTLLNIQWKTLKNHAWFTGTTLFLLITTPWFYMASKVHPDFLRYFFINENFKRFISSNYGDRYGTGHEYFDGMAALFFSGGAQPWLIILITFIIYKLWNLNKNKRIIYLLQLFTNNAPKKNISYFFLAYASIVLFWCATNRLHFYYLITVIPPFAVWCSEIFNKEKIPFKLIYYLALTTITVYVIIYAIIPFAGEQKITKYIITLIKEKENNKLKPHSIYFFSRQHPSAYYYAGNALILHKPEPFDKALKRNADYYICKSKNFKSPVKNTKIIYKDKAWIILKKGITQ